MPASPSTFVRTATRTVQPSPRRGSVRMSAAGAVGGGWRRIGRRPPVSDRSARLGSVPDCECGCGAQATKRYLNGHARRPVKTLQQQADAVYRRVTQGPGCWQWSGQWRLSTSSSGLIDRRPTYRGRYVYRVLYEWRVGPIPEGMVLHHRCGNSECVNPSHCEPTTQGRHLVEHGLSGDNHQAAKTHCPRGHEYTPDNTYVYRGRGSVERRCRECSRIIKRLRRASAQKAA